MRKDALKNQHLGSGMGLPQVDKGKNDQKFLVADLVGKLSNHQAEYRWVG
jgi:hypothetical protein